MFGAGAASQIRHEGCLSSHRVELEPAVLDGYGSKKIATVLRLRPEISMSPDRQGSGATRIEADLSSTEER
jgi:hypothetical protein